MLCPSSDKAHGFDYKDKKIKRQKRIYLLLF